MQIVRIFMITMMMIREARAKVVKTIMIRMVVAMVVQMMRVVKIII